MLKGFREFILRGNVIDLAVAVVLGSAFAALVDTVVSALITPLVNSFGGVESRGLGFTIVGSNPATFVDVSAVINAVVVFLITAAVVYFLVVTPMNRLSQLRKRGVEEPEEVSEELATLREIRDLLAGRGGAAG